MIPEHEKTRSASALGTSKSRRDRLGRSAVIIALVGVVIAFLGTATAFTAVYFQQRQFTDLIRLQHQDRRELVRVQTGLEMTKRFDSLDMRRNRRSIAKILLTKPNSLIDADWRVFDFFETLAQYHFQHRIDSDTIDTNFSYYVIYYWEAAKDQIGKFRKQENDRSYYADFEQLDKEVIEQKAAEERRPIASIRPSPERMKQFLKDEATLSL